MSVGPHTHTEHELRFPPQYQTSYKWGFCWGPCRLRVLYPVRRPMTTLD